MRPAVAVLSGGPVSGFRRAVASNLALAFLLSLLLLSLLLLTVPRPAPAADLGAGISVLAVDRVGEPGVAPAADVLSVAVVPTGDGPALRVAFLHLGTDTAMLGPQASAAANGVAAVPVRISAAGRTLLEGTLAPRGTSWELATVATGSATRDRDALLVPLPADLLAGGDLAVTVRTQDGEKVEASWPPLTSFAANCALVLHGNQGIGYTDVFVGRGDDLDGSGFDEALQIHEALQVPVNVHLAATLMTVADWNVNQGDPLDFNGWLAGGVSAGWVGMLTSAYAQHIMPFVHDEMNDWAVHTETQMVIDRYGYTPTVAWVPERVWLNTGGYPSAGVNDWIGDNWQPHGVGAVILDDDVHLAGHDNHQIHTLAANGLRLIPRDRQFTGNIIGGNGQAALDILTAMANSGVGQYRIAVMAEDWEAVAEMGGWAQDTPQANETYNWIVDKLGQESAWLSTWKLADAVANPDFTGATITPSPGTYWEIGGPDGYGGNDNAWYTHWAGWVPYATGGDGDGTCAGQGGNCKDYGTLWNDAYAALMSAPDNTIAQAGWYVLMTKLYETGWHDGLGGPISGWQHNYAGHIKQAMIYAEAARWADGQYAATTAAYPVDVDNDGFDEYVLHNDRLFAVFETTGGRLTNLFVKGPGHEDTAIGVDNAYWSGTTADFNDANHVGAFSDVGPDRQHQPYAFEVLDGDGDDGEVRVRATHQTLSKEFVLRTGDAWLEAVYRVGPGTQWLQAGWSPSLVDLIWNAQMDRVWTADQAYMGQRNPSTGVTVGWVLGAGGAAHQLDFTRTLMKADEIRGSGTFQVRLYAGVTSAPGGGEIAEMRAVADALVDTVGPGPVSASWSSTGQRLRVTFDQPVDPATASAAGLGFDADGDGLAEVTVGSGGTVVSGDVGWVLEVELDAATAAAVDALDPVQLRVLLPAGTVEDTAGNANLDAAAAVDVLAALRVTIDGQFAVDEWGDFTLDDAGDSEWTSANEIESLHVTWDDTYLYLGLEGRVDDNSWILYLDVDPGSGNGETDLTQIDAWERGATFSAPGFAADFQYAAYQHASPFDSQGLWELLSPTTTQDRSGEAVMAFDPLELFGADGGSEVAIPWNTLYGLGDGNVPAGAQISVVASLCWDPEPDGELGGDSAPSNQAAALPEIDTVWTLDVDTDGDGRPDSLTPTSAPEAPAAALALLAPYPNPFNPQVTLAFELPDAPGPASLAIFDARGRRIAVLVDQELPPGRHTAVWDGRDQTGRTVAAGTYFSRLEHAGQVSTRVLSLVK
jgi:hypothetical protein